MTDIPENQYPVLLDIINETYSDQAEAIASARVEDNGDILCIAQDGPKILGVRITDEEIFIRLVNPDEGETAEAAFAESQPDTVDRFVSQLREKARPEFEQMLATVRRALEDSEDLVQFREKVDTLYPNLDGEALTRLMAEAMFASRLAGIFEAQEGG